jgi:hypothetical protein
MAEDFVANVPPELQQMYGVKALDQWSEGVAAAANEPSWAELGSSAMAAAKENIVDPLIEDPRPLAAVPLRIAGEVGGGLLGAGAGTALGGLAGSVAGTVGGSLAGGQAADLLLEAVGLQDPKSNDQRLTDLGEEAKWEALFTAAPAVAKATKAGLHKMFKVSGELIEAAMQTKSPNKVLTLLGASIDEKRTASAKSIVSTYERFEKEMPNLHNQIFNTGDINKSYETLETARGIAGKNLEKFYTSGLGKDVYVSPEEFMAHPTVEKLVNQISNIKTSSTSKQEASAALGEALPVFNQMLGNMGGDALVTKAPTTAADIWRKAKELEGLNSKSAMLSDATRGKPEDRIALSMAFRDILTSKLRTLSSGSDMTALKAKKMLLDNDTYHYTATFRTLFDKAVAKKGAGGTLATVVESSAKAKNAQRRIGLTLAGGAAGYSGGPLGQLTGAAAGLGIDMSMDFLGSHAGRVAAKGVADRLQDIASKKALGEMSLAEMEELSKYAAMFGSGVYTAVDGFTQEPEKAARGYDEDSLLTIEQVATQIGSLKEGETIDDLPEEELEVVIKDVLLHPSSKGVFKSPPQNSYAYDMRSYWEGKILDDGELELVRNRVKADTELSLEQQTEILDGLNSSRTLINTPKPYNTVKRAAKVSGKDSMFANIPKKRASGIEDLVIN